MIRLETFFKNHFDTERITDGRVKAFSEDHINKCTAYLSVHPNPVIQALLDALLPVHNSYFGAITDEQVKFAIQQSRTIAADNAWNLLLGFIRQKEGTVRGIWGKTAPEYQEFYPLGLEEYNQSNKQNRETIVERYMVSVTTHAAALGAAFVTDYTNVKNDWKTKFTTQQQQIGLVKDADSQTDSNRTVLEVQLMRSIMGIASVFVGQTDMTVVFFNQQLLERPETNTNVTVSGILTSNATGLPIAGAQFVMGPYTFTSAADGSFSKSFYIAAVTTYDITITAAGFETVNSTVQFTPGVDVEQDLQMTPVVGVGSLSGTVSDAGTLMGINGASINISGPGVAITTNADANGNYNVGGIPAGTYTVTANAPGYLGQSVSVTINANSNTIQNFSLVVMP